MWLLNTFVFHQYPSRFKKTQKHCLYFGKQTVKKCEKKILEKMEPVEF